jgi:hypothetical protein
MHHRPLLESSKLTLKHGYGSEPPRCRLATCVRYKGIIERSIAVAPIGTMLLRKLRPSHLEAYYAAATVCPATFTLHHAILHRALRKAAKAMLLAFNVAADLDRKPRHRRSSEAAREHYWTAAEARDFLVVAKAAGPQPAPCYAPALDSGMRKAELCGLYWTDPDLESGVLQVLRPAADPHPSTVRGASPRPTAHPPMDANRPDGRSDHQRTHHCCSVTNP